MSSATSPYIDSALFHTTQWASRHSSSAITLVDFVQIPPFLKNRDLMSVPSNRAFPNLNILHSPIPISY